MARRLGFVSTYPPTQCGLATFTASLEGALTGPGRHDSVVVRSLDTSHQGSLAAGGAELVMGDHRGIAASALRLNTCDAVILQHEFGIYGGEDGEDVLRLLGRLEVPSIVVLHTVLTTPTAHQREIVEAVVAAADAIVTMTRAAADRLRDNYSVDLAKVRIIPHGAPPATSAAGTLRAPFGDGRPTVLTWGLLGPGKGIEWGIEAMARLGDLRPAPQYVIAGQTHPKVVAHEGEAYRRRLAGRIRDLGLETAVRFDPHYRDAAALADLISSADVVLLPYDSTEQVTSGVLIEAVAAGKPVVATAFPHAMELLGDGTGIVVPHHDPDAIAAALRTVLTERHVAAAMAAKASATTANMLWPAIGAQYGELLSGLIRAGVAA